MIVAAVANTRELWYVTRGTGVVALLLLTAAVALGVLTTLRWRSARWPRFVSAGLHRNLTLLAIAFVAIHVVTTVLDGYAPIGFKDAVLPFLSRYRPVWLGLGAVAFDLLLALVVTSLLRVRLGHRVWRSVHWLAYAAWPVAFIHSLGTGSDARVGWMTSVAFASLAVVVAAVLARVALAHGRLHALRLAGASAAVVVPLLILAWYHAGPGRAGWAKRAGTPAGLLARSRAVRSAAVRDSAASATPQAFSVPLRGTIAESSDANGLVTVVIRGRLKGGPGGAVRIDLRGEPTEDGVAMSASGVSFMAATRTVYSGAVTALVGRRVEAVVANSTGRRLRLDFALSIDTSAGIVSGTVAGAAA